MDHEKPNDKAALKDAQAGVPVAEKDFSPAFKEKLANGTPGKLPLPSTGKQAHGYGHPSSAQSGKLRNSGHSGAHQLGKRK